MESAVESLFTCANVDVSRIPSQHLQFGHIAPIISKVRHLVVAVMLAEAFLAEGSREHIVQETTLVRVEGENPAIRFCRKDGVERFAQAWRIRVVGDLQAGKSFVSYHTASSETYGEHVSSIRSRIVESTVLIPLYVTDGGLSYTQAVVRRGGHDGPEADEVWYGGECKR